MYSLLFFFCRARQPFWNIRGRAPSREKERKSREKRLFHGSNPTDTDPVVKPKAGMHAGRLIPSRRTSAFSCRETGAVAETDGRSGSPRGLFIAAAIYFAQVWLVQY